MAGKKWSYKDLENMTYEEYRNIFFEDILQEMNRRMIKMGQMKTCILQHKSGTTPYAMVVQYLQCRFVSH
ncbi:unnamed protein product [Acanthoscelides obtectus]|uniref:Uncharacterized protein n=1 Tax=Acanthoscelides obtectus TaxID=200917 RepID=A0A9P0QGG6_ACAOB|nr:unnamed protein product [Acanthoscelides obtectus]CAH2019551.1 unnamed protein product [Acanthoscelides obtectus]CAK1620887.1 hypothetical protein AOBTE_LOCUS636 [Acanthoscelides obtectus]CAK1620901.1 hypothetical protein AOBTE_LOCUS644 [Acanthoscelides obtectus]